MIMLKQIENIVKEKTKSVKSIAHGFGHLKRTAMGARWFVVRVNGSKKEQDLAYIAGLIHDLYRPLTEKIDHTESSVKDARNLLLELNVDRDVINMVLELIKVHRKPSEKSIFKQSVYLADKIFEQMGAYVTFRVCAYVGECKDYLNVPPMEVIKRYFEMRINRISKSDFPKKLSGLVNYQWKWLMEYASALNKEEKWAICIAKTAYENGRTHKLSLENMIKNFKPKSKKGIEYKKEALDYINGKKFNRFELLIP
jgi:HD superfamily phosphohydrolase YqeK